jgi:hypothetical protein
VAPVSRTPCASESRPSLDRPRTRPQRWVAPGRWSERLEVRNSPRRCASRRRREERVKEEVPGGQGSPGSSRPNTGKHAHFRAGSTARWRGSANEVSRAANPGTPAGALWIECFWKRSGFGTEESPVSVVEKYRYGLPEPRRGHDQIDGMVAVHISRLDQQSARRRDQPNGLRRPGTEMEFDQIRGCRRARSPALHRGQVGALVPIKIGDCKGQARSARQGRPRGHSCPCSSRLTDEDHGQGNEQ